MGNETKVEIGGKLNQSFPSTIDKIKAGVHDVVKEVASLSAEVAIHEAKTKTIEAVLEAGWDAVKAGGKRALEGLLPYVPRLVGGLAVIAGSVKILSGAMALFDKGSEASATGLAKLGQLENLQSKLQSVTGGAEAAKAKLKELAGTFANTDIDLGDAAGAYKNSEVLTGGELSDKKGMTMLGDVATESGNGIKETSLAVGKFYDDLQAGRPVEETAKKLEDMGIISGDVHAKITAMLNEGQSGAGVWNMLTVELDKSGGAMARARDNLTSLQKAAADAKDKLYMLFAEGQIKMGDGGAKDQLKDQIKVLEDLQPAAEEAGSIFGNLTAKSDTATSSINKFYARILEGAGSLKKWVDVLFVGGAALTGLAGGILVTAGVFLTLAAGTLAVGGAIAAGVAAIAAGFFIHAVHAKQAAERQDALISATIELNNKLQKERDAIGSVTDKAVALAHAYTALKQAKEAYAAAKDPVEKDQLALRVKVAERGVVKLEKIDDSTLTASDARAKSEGDLADLQSKDDFNHLSDDAKTEVLDKRYTDAAWKGEGLRTRMLDAEQAAQPSEDGKVDGSRAGTEQAAESARTAFAAQEVEVEKAREAYEAQRKISDEKKQTLQTRLAELSVEQKVAALETEGLTRARQEWGYKRQLLVAELQTAEASKDAQKAGENAVKAAEAKAKIAQGDAAYGKQIKAGADEKDGIDTEMKIAALQTEGVARIRQESDLRLKLIEHRWKEAEAAQNTAEIDKQRLAYYQEQVRAAKEVADAQAATAERATALQTAQRERADNKTKREADAALAAGQITPEQRRSLDIEDLRKKQREASEEAKQLQAQADAEAKLGHDKKAGELGVEAQKRQQQADTYGFDAADLLNKPNARPVADNLARLGLGGNVGLGDPGKELSRKMDKQTQVANLTLEVLKQIRDKSANSQPAKGYFPR